MPVIQGSINHTYSGRRKKTVRRVKKATPVFKPLQPRADNRRETPHYPSADGKYDCAVKTPEYKKEVSSQYTISIAFNKGAYQVIGKENIKHIGK